MSNDLNQQLRAVLAARAADLGTEAAPDPSPWLSVGRQQRRSKYTALAAVAVLTIAAGSALGLRATKGRDLGPNVEIGTQPRGDQFPSVSRCYEVLGTPNMTDAEIQSDVDQKLAARPDPITFVGTDGRIGYVSHDAYRPILEAEDRGVVPPLVATRDETGRVNGYVGGGVGQLIPSEVVDAPDFDLTDYAARWRADQYNASVKAWLDLGLSDAEIQSRLPINGWRCTNGHEDSAEPSSLAPSGASPRTDDAPPVGTATGPRVVVSAGTTDGGAWELVAYESDMGLCVELHFGASSAAGCGSPPGRVNFGRARDGTGHAWAFGSAPLEVTSLLIEFEDNPPTRVETTASTGFGWKFFASPIPNDATVTRVSSIDASGAVVEIVKPPVLPGQTNR